MNELPTRWFSFSLRTLFVVVTVAAIVLSWILYQLEWVRQRPEALKWAKPMGYAPKDYKPAPWSIQLIERGVPFILIDPEAARDTDKVAKLKQLFPEAKLYVGASRQWTKPDVFIKRWEI